MPLTLGTPGADHNGILDDSIVQALPEPLQLPQHLPLFYMQTERGRARPYPVIGTQLNKLYGAKSFNEREKYFSHQTQAAVIANNNANMIMIKRVLGTGAAKATLRLSLEIGEDVFKPYDREVDGTVKRDAGGVKLRDAGGVDITGRICRWLITEVTTATFGLDVVTVGAPYGSAGNASAIYPIMDFEADSEGDWGNNVGLRLWFPHSRTSSPGDIDTMDEAECNIYRAQFVERASPTKSPVVTYNTNQARVTDFATKTGVLSETNVGYEPDNLVKSYQNLTPGYVPQYGPTSKFHLYEDHLATLSGVLHGLEDTANASNPVAETRYNIFDAIDEDGIDYYSFYMDPTGISLNEHTTNYFLGGADGTVSEAELNTQVETECMTNWENPDYPLVDKAQFPISVIYDTGFTQATKEAMLSCLGYRDDISVAVCTQDLSLAENDIASETAMGSVLRTAARLVPESVLHGTSTCRAVIMGQMGTMTDSVYKRRLPVIMELIHKRSKFMGAASGLLKASEAYDISPNNRLEIMTDITHTYKGKTIRDKDWVTGINYVQHSKMNEIFFPAYQTVYDNDTSVLNSEIVMLLAVHVKKMQEYLWTEFTGRGDLTNEQYVERVNERFLELVADRYLQYIGVESNAFFTAADLQRNNSFSHAAIVTARGQKTAATLDIIARRDDQ